MNNVLAVVLGGGAGKRLFPLTATHAKPAISLLGKYRLVDIPITNCLRSGIERIFVLTQFNSASLHRHLSETYRFDAYDDRFVSILAAEQTPHSSDWFRGTADAVRQVLHHLDHHAGDYVLVLSGDQIYDMDYETLYRHHVERDADITVATTPVTAEDATSFGIMQISGDDTITVFREKPAPAQLAGLRSPVTAAMEQAGRHYLASTGIYLFKKDVLRKLLLEDRSRHDFGKDIIPSALDLWKVVSYPFDGYWSDVGSIRSYHAANIAMTQPKPSFDFHASCLHMRTRAEALPPAKIIGSLIHDAIICEGSNVTNARIYHSVLGIRSIVGERSTLKNTVMMGADYYEAGPSGGVRNVSAPDHPGVGEACFIENAVIDMNARIGNGSVLANQENVQEGEGAFYYIRDGIIVIPRNAVVPEGTLIGVTNVPIHVNRLPAEYLKPAVSVGMAAAL
ncbi:MAG: glucose-1-phosphate adenylyltransferase [Rhodothermales bacterium]